MKGDKKYLNLKLFYKENIFTCLRLVCFPFLLQNQYYVRWLHFSFQLWE